MPNHPHRRDHGQWLFHWTRAQEGRTAYEVLSAILSIRKLRASSAKIRGGFPCVCFTETPVFETTAYFTPSKAGDQPRYEPYGIAVRKDWLFKRGGRPVIYQPNVEYDLLPLPLRWRHCRYEPGTSDFTWEREWRICGDVGLDPPETIVVAPTYDEAAEFLLLSPDAEVIGVDCDGRPDWAPQYVWKVVSLELLLGNAL